MFVSETVSLCQAGNAMKYYQLPCHVANYFAKVVNTAEKQKARSGKLEARRIRGRKVRSLKLGCNDITHMKTQHKCRALLF